MKKIVSIVACIASLYASDGTLDPSFGTGGTVSITAPAGLVVNSVGHRAFIDAQGRIYMNGGGFIVRLTSSGTVDTTFNSAGVNPGYVDLSSLVTTTIKSILVQPDGKILLSGQENGTQIFITRLNSDGTFDQTFNNGQVVFTTVATSAPFPSRIALQADEKIVVSVEVSASAEILLVRYTSSGALDTTFNGTGIVQTPITNGIPGSTAASSISVNAQGKIIAAGYALLTGDSEFRVMVAQYNSDGSLDTTFAPGGSAQAGIFLSVAGFVASANTFFVPWLQIQPDGKLVIGTTTFPPAENIQVLRLTTQGVLDSSFNGSGFSAEIPNAEFSELLLQSDGKLVVVGVNTISPQIFVVGRLTATGQLDTSFGFGAGFVTTSFSGNSSAFTGALAQNGFILAAGVDSDNSDLVFARYEVATPLDPTTIQVTSTGETGTAQPLSIIEVFVDGLEVCETQTTTGIWSCVATIPAGTHIIEAVAHYPGGSVNIAGSCERTFPQSALSFAISNKYCPC